MQFKTAVDIVIGLEGGYVDDPLDRGGETKFGISKRAHPEIDIKNLTREGAEHFYFLHYWEPMKMELFPPSLRLCIFDAAVNHGKILAARLVQAACGVEKDGVIGPGTLGAVHRMNRIDFKRDFMAERAILYTKIPTFERYGRGWMRRLFTVFSHG